MSKKYKIGENFISISDISKIINEDIQIELSDISTEKVVSCRKYLDKKIEINSDPIYGVNTGFGSLCNHKISEDNLEQLQKNLIVSHACGIGDAVPNVVVKIMILLKIQSLSYGHSAVQLVTLNRLIEMFNRNILPIIYQQGSLGASGDLAPLAHMSLVLLGMGEVNVLNDKGKYVKKPTSEIMKQMNWESIKLKSKEGLALLNGTQFMGAYGVWSLIKSKKISYLSDIIGAISLEAFDGRNECFDELIHLIRGHKGQIKTAENIRDLLEGSEIQNQKKEHVQDPYSFRCIPQVHGATKDVLSHVEGVFTTEINSVTDNPTVFPKEDKIISGGNFHGQPLAMSMDYLALSIAELGNISERRTYQLISGLRGLPLFLVAEPGLNSGMMIPQYTAASIVSQNKQLCVPASSDSIVSSNGQEDHVSMGANSGTKLYKVVENVERILAIELMNAVQAITFRNHTSSVFIEKFIDSYKQEVSFLNKDRLLYTDIQKSVDFLQSIHFSEDLL